ncbi:unnamed protein product [Rotaria sp. Silwood1]|nr:unnamed protein product [Rotaria sp. Silwood1]
MGVNTKRDRLALDFTFTQFIDLTRILSNEQNNSGNKSIFDRFCYDILPQIQHNIECLTLDSLSIDRVLYIGSYPKLHKHTLVNLSLDMASHIFNNCSSFVQIFKYQILHLTITIHEDRSSEHKQKLSTNVFVIIFTMFMNLIYLHFGLNDNLFYSTTSLIDLLSATYYPSNIVHFNVRVCGFDDCLR